MNLDLSTLSLTGIGSTGFVTLIVLLIILGKLIPLPWYKDIVKDRDTWREIAMNLDKQNQQLMQAGRLTVRTVEAVAQHAQRSDQEELP